jgi:hypothetical protein
MASAEPIPGKYYRFRSKDREYDGVFPTGGHVWNEYKGVFITPRGQTWYEFIEYNPESTWAIRSRLVKRADILEEISSTDPAYKVPDVALSLYNRYANQTLNSTYSNWLDIWEYPVATYSIDYLKGIFAQDTNRIAANFNALSALEEMRGNIPENAYSKIAEALSGIKRTSFAQQKANITASKYVAPPQNM